MTAPPRSDDGPAEDGIESGPIRVLHVDDDPAVGTLTADLLERESDPIQVLTEQSARAGLDRLANEEIHCVVSDHDMAETDGIEFLRTVREEYGDLPFILFTGKGSEEIASEAISAGVTDYLQKETGTDQYAVLANRVENAVEQYRTRNALEKERTRRSALFENTPDPIMETEVIDDRLVVRSVNAAFEDVFGYESDDIVGRTVAESVIPTGVREEYEDIREQVLSGEAVETTVRRETTDGTREFRLRAIPVTSSDGTPNGDYAWYTDITDQKRHRRRMETLSNAFPDLAFIIDEDGRNVDLLGSPRSEGWLYTDPDETVGKHIQDIFPTEQSDEFMSMIRRTLETDRTRTVEYQLDVQVGTRWFEAKIAPLSAEIDGKRAVTWVSRDVTERTERERALRALHDVATGITRADSTDAVCRRTLEAAAEVLEFDHGAIAVEGTGEDTVITHRREGGIDPEIDVSLSDGLAAAVHRSGESVVVDDGREHDATSPEERYGGAVCVPVGEYGVLQAVTGAPGAFDEDDREIAELLVSHTALALERLEHDRTLQRNQRRFEAVFDNPLSLIGLLEPDGAVIDANRTALDIVEPGSQDVVGEPFWQTPWWSHSTEQQERLREWVSRAADGEYVRFEADHRTADDERIDVDGVLHPVEDEGGDLAEIMVAARDVTAVKERQRELERQNERLDEFASIVSHDLRNPLGVLKGSLALAEETDGSADLERCRRAANRMETLIDDLLTLAREGESVANKERVELAAVAESCWRTVETYDATLRVDTDAAVRANEGRLRQLLENLFRNAVEHGGDDVVVTVGALEDGEGFYVEDDGPGIPRDERDRVFESGYSTARGGTGFGLSIAARIVEAHDWRLEASASEDGGARFEIADVQIG